MKSGFADLHIHTTFSDGTADCGQIIKDANAAGLSCISITDHDTIEGIDCAIEAVRGFNIEVISGIELSTEVNDKDIHILGYLFDYKEPSLINTLNCIQGARIQRMKMMIEKFKELGIADIDFDEVAKETDPQSLGRPHLAAVLLKKKIVSSIKEAFDRYLADGASCYVPKYKQTPTEAIQLIRDLGGAAVLAHPMTTQVDELIPGFVRAGLQGLEAVYPNVSRAGIEFYKNLAKKYNLVVTGGSDYHGKVREDTYIGKEKLPYEYVEELKKAAGNK